MKAAIFHGSGKPLAVEEVPEPSIREDEVLVKVAACGLCHTDLHYLDHGVPTAKAPPVILGHEASGTVARVGSEVREFKEGDPVIVPAVISCGRCRSCRANRANICENMRMYGNHIDGAFAEYVAAPARELFRIPRNVPLDAACVIGDAVTTGYHAVVNRGRVRSGDKAAVFGCGGIGINVLQMAAAHGAEVLAVDKDPAKLELAKQFGAARVLQPGPDAPLAKEVRKATDGGVDVAFECIGVPAVVREAHGSIRRGGRLVLVGYCEKPVELAASKIMFLEHEIVGSLGCPPSYFPNVLKLIEEGKVWVDPLVTGRFPLDAINEGLDALRSSRGLRNIIAMDGL